MSQGLKVALCQLEYDLGDFTGNCQKVSNYINDNNKQDLLIFAELAISGYPLEDLLQRPHLIQEVIKHFNNLLANLPHEHPPFVIGLPIDDGGKIYNALVLVQNQKIVYKYYKVRLANFAMFSEKRNFAAGDFRQLKNTYNLNGFKISFAICEDIWSNKIIDEIIKQKPDLLISINASPYIQGKCAYRLNRANKIITQSNKTINKNIVFIYVNYFGAQDEIVFDGSSFVLAKTTTNIQEDPQVVQLTSFREACLQLELNNLAQDGIKLKTMLATINYDEHANLLQALIYGVQQYFCKNPFSNFILGLSGGIDSALSLYIVTEALIQLKKQQPNINKESKIYAFMLSTKYTSDISITNAQQQVALLNKYTKTIFNKNTINGSIINYHHIELENICQAYNNVININSEIEVNNLVFENIQARIRGSILMAFANNLNGLVVATSNKSETAVGYTTIYGDMVGGYSVIKDLYKTEIYSLCAFINQKHDVEIIAKNIIKREPSAELRDNQKDSDSLPKYELLDKIIKAYVEDLQTPSKISKSLDANLKLVQKIAHMIDSNEFKRRQGAIGTIVSKVSFNKDRIYPIVSKYSEP